MLDYGHQWTQSQIDSLESRIAREYRHAHRAAKRKLNDYLSKYKDQDKEKRALVKSGELSKAEYKDWKAGRVFIGNRWEQMRDTLAADMALTDVKVSSIINGYLPEAYAENFNFSTYQIEQGLNASTSFTLYDRSTVEYLVRERPKLLPETKIDIPKDEKWSKTKIQSEVTQSVLLGEPIDALADRLMSITNMSLNAAVRNARTAMTGAQNAGREDSYIRAVDMGIKMKQQWVATPDARTRASHAAMDGELAEVGEKFSNGCRYPGDPSGDPSEVYNCRCTLVAALDDMDNDISDLGLRYSNLDGVSYEEWKDQHQTEEQKLVDKIDSLKNQLDQIGNKTYSGIWKEDVHTSDYEKYKDRIQGKRDYYESQLSTLDPSSAKYAQFQKYLADLKEFEKNGPEYVRISSELAQAKKDYAAIAPQKGQFAADAWDESVKQAARRFLDRIDADKLFRADLDLVWDDLEDQEKYAVWEYTQNSHPMNKPLSGYHDSWNRRDYIGPENTDWGHEDRWRSIPSSFEKFGKNGNVDYHATISAATRGIDKSSLPEDAWLVRGSDSAGLAGLVADGTGLDFKFLEQMIDSGDVDSLKGILEGGRFMNHAFTSTGIASDAGLSGNVSYSIYAPAGTHAIYAEPQSYWGSTIGRKAELYKTGQSYSGVGGEAEVIIQRGTTYRITEVSRKGYRDIHITMEVVEQPDYFVHGDEDTFNGGKTRHKK